MNREYALPGYVAIALAILFPVYWVSAMWQGLGTPSVAESFRANITHLDPLDGLFLLTVVMEGYLYLNLRRVLNHHLQGGLCAILLTVLVVFLGLFGAGVLFDVMLTFGEGLSDNARE